MENFMKYLKISEATHVGENARIAFDSGLIESRAGDFLEHLKTKISRNASFDIFLSHSHKDVNSDAVIGVYTELESRGFSVYVDSIVEPSRHPHVVTPKTADRLRLRMKQSSVMVFLHTKNTINSKWCPWELGYFDGGGAPKGIERVYILPLVGDTGEYQGQEYLGLYPIIEIDNFGLVNQSLVRKTVDRSSDDVWGRWIGNPRAWLIRDIIRRLNTQ